MPDRISADVTARFRAWRRSVIGAKSNREVKGQELTPNQLYSFAYKVFPPATESPRITVCGCDTRFTDIVTVTTIRDQVSAQMRESANIVRQHNPGNTWLIQQYTEGAGWIRKRSPENVLWIHALEETVLQNVQHSVVYFMEPEDDPEFENMEIRIDKSFIRQEQHINFWREWLRNGLVNRSHRRPFVTPHTWRHRNHPFQRKYSRGEGLLEFNDLYMKHMGFADSQSSVGLQIADICAHINLRYHRGEDLPAYHWLRRWIVGEGGRNMTLIGLDQRSVIQDDIKNHVHVFDREATRKLARERRQTHRQHMGREAEEMNLPST